MEDQLYIVQVGSELFIDQGFYYFNKEDADYHYFQVKDALSELIHHGTKADQRKAVKAITDFRVLPFTRH